MSSFSITVALVTLVIVAAIVGWRYRATRSIARDYRIPISELHRPDAAPFWDTIEPIWTLSTGDGYNEKLPRVWSNVTEGQLLVYAVTWVDREVVNGGFWGYFYNMDADLPLIALDGFRKIGADDYARIMEQAIAVFPGGRMPPTSAERRRLLPDDPDDGCAPEQQEMLDKWDELDDRFYALHEEYDRFWKYLDDYVRANKEQFYR